MVVTAVSLAASGGARAAGDDSLERARAHYERGERLYQVSRYREALEEFKEAYVVHPDPAFLFNIGQCHRLLRETEQALTFYRRYLRAVPDAPGRTEVERRIAELEAQSKPPPRVDLQTTSPPSPAETPPTSRARWIWLSALAAAVLLAGGAAVWTASAGPSGCGPGVDRCLRL